MHEVDRRTRSHVANFVSRSMQKLCVIHVRAPPDQYQTNTVPCPIIEPVPEEKSLAELGWDRPELDLKPSQMGVATQKMPL